MFHQDRDERRLPVVAVDDVGTEAGLSQKFQYRSAKEGEAPRIVGIIAGSSPVEKIPAEVLIVLKKINRDVLQRGLVKCPGFDRVAESYSDALRNCVDVEPCYDRRLI